MILGVRLASCCALAACVLFVGGPAHADDPPPPATTPATAATTPPPPVKREPTDHFLYASISPLHLLAGPIVELMAEFRLHRKIGVAVIGGYGSVGVETTRTVVRNGSLVSEKDEVRFKVWEVGGQFVGYPVGHYDHGMQLGLELMYLGVSGDTTSGNVKVTGAGNGLAVGPFVGYKYVAEFGLSVNVQLGVSYLATRAEASSSAGETASKRDSDFFPNLNANVGWSF